MSKVTIDAYHTVGRPYRVAIDPDATVGASVGVNLVLAASVTLPGGVVLPAGYVIPASEILNAFVTQSNGQGASSDWALLTNIPANVVSAAVLTTAGLVTRQVSGAWVTRGLAQPSTGFTIANANGDTGNPTFALANDLAAVEGLSGTGLAVRSASDTWVQRVLATASSARITVANGSGVSGDPTVDLATLANSGIGTLQAVTVDSWGRVSGYRAATLSDFAIGGGTTAQFLRGDGAWSDTLVGQLRLQASGGTISTINSADANGRLRLTGNGASGQTGLIDLDPNPLDGTSGATLRVLRSTSTTGATGLQVFVGNNTSTFNHFFAGQGGDTSIALTSGNIALLGTGSFGSGAKVVFIANRTTAPTVNPVGGGIMYAEGGALKWRGSAGTTTTIGPA